MSFAWEKKLESVTCQGVAVKTENSKFCSRDVRRCDRRDRRLRVKAIVMGPCSLDDVSQSSFHPSSQHLSD